MISLASSLASDERVVHTERWFLAAALPARVRVWFIADNAPFPASSLTIWCLTAEQSHS